VGEKWHSCTKARNASNGAVFEAYNFCASTKNKVAQLHRKE